MWTNDKNWLTVFSVLLLASITLPAQWREVRFAKNHIVSHVIAADDGRGMVFLTDTNMRVVITRDDWRTFDTVLLPKPDSPYVFEPYSYDTTANGTVVVVGQHRPPLDTVLDSYHYLRHCNTTTAAYYSTNWGTTWTEVLPRQRGRYMSISFRGRQEGIILYELDWNDSLEYTDAAPMYDYWGRDLITVDQRMQPVSKKVIDKGYVYQRRPGRSYCIEGNPIMPGFVDRINDTVLVMETVLPCENDLGIEDAPPGSHLTQPAYVLWVSTDLGSSWKLGRDNGNFSDHSRYHSMKIVDDTTWIDNQGYIYEGTTLQPRKLDCAEWDSGGSYSHYWFASDVQGKTLIELSPLRYKWIISDSASVQFVNPVVLFINPITCTSERDEKFKYVFTIEPGFRLRRFEYRKPQLLKNGRAIVSIASVSVSLGSERVKPLFFQWSIFILDKETSLAPDGTAGAASTLEERNGEILLNRILSEPTHAEYYSLTGSLVARVLINAGASQTTVPSLSAGVYFVRIANEAPLKIMVR